MEKLFRALLKWFYTEHECGPYITFYSTKSRLCADCGKETPIDTVKIEHQRG